MSLKIFFWNIYGLNDSRKETANFDFTIRAIEELTKQNLFDIIIISECPNDNIRNLIESRLQNIDKKYKNHSQFGSRIVIFHKLNNTSETINLELLSYLTINSERKIMIVGLHLHGRNMGTSEEELYEDAAIYKQSIMYLAKQEEADDIIIIGDFNMDPFEKGLVSRKKFNATFFRPVALGKIPEEETILDKIKGEEPTQYPYFFNPSWHLHGNGKNPHDNPEKNIPGTYYSRSSQNQIIYHMLDQVLISPNLIDNFNLEDFEIVTQYLYENKEVSLVSKNGIPIKKNYSDHLPIKFEVNI
ncbi:hypothetical protein [Bacillus sp. RC51]|uniref:endonuclease/exonuclease/phosphatase family protein n=1 Tax=Bacillus TaxID=1386 RepID=UPI0038353F3F